MRALALAVALLCLAVAPATAAEKVVALAHLNKNVADDNPTAAMAIAFKRTLEEISGKSIRVDIYPDGQLGGDAQTIPLVQKGVIQSAISSVGGIAKVYPLIGVLDYPFAFDRIEETYTVFDGPFGRRLSDDMERKAKVRVIGYGDQGGFFALTNSVRPVRSPKDMAGLKIRTMGLDSHKTFIKSLGGEAVGMAWKDVYGALKSHIVDGQMNPISIIGFAHFDDVQGYMTLTNHFFTPYVWAFNPAFYAGLSDKEKTWVEAAAKAGVEASRVTARKMVDSERGLGSLRQRMEVYKPTAAEMAEFRRVAQPAADKLMAEKFGKEGEEMLAVFKAAVMAARGK